MEQQSIGTSSSKQIINYKTPDQPIVVNTDPRRHKKAKKVPQLQREASINEFEESFIEQFEQLQGKDTSKNSTPKRPRSESGQEKLSCVPKYAKLSPDKERIVTGYYTAGQEEKHKEFSPAYVNIGNPFHPKELVGVSKKYKIH